MSARIIRFDGAGKKSSSMCTSTSLPWTAITMLRMASGAGDPSGINSLAVEGVSDPLSVSAGEPSSLNIGMMKSSGMDSRSSTSTDRSERLSPRRSKVDDSVRVEVVDELVLRSLSDGRA